MIKTSASAAVAFLALQSATLIVADTPPAATGDACSSGGNIIGITLDSSGSIVPADLDTARTQVANFVDSTSGLPDTNGNLYYLSYFSSFAYGGSASLQTNAGRQVSDAFEAVDPFVGGTDIVAGMKDIEAAFRSSGVNAGVAIVVTDGGCCGEDLLKAAGDDLRSLGVTVVGVGIGFADQLSLEAFTSKGSDGKPLVFSGEQFDQIESLLVGALQDIDSDGDGESDCVDGCPSDPLKTSPGNCGCGVSEDACDDVTTDRDLDTDSTDPEDVTTASEAPVATVAEDADAEGPAERMSLMQWGPGYGYGDAAGYGYGIGE